MSRYLSVFLLACCVLGCGDSAGTPPAVDGATDAGPDAPEVATLDDIQCGTLPPIGPGNVAEFQKHLLDPAEFPDALCNDGTPARLYYRPYQGAANRNRWIINLHGGGICSGGNSCLARWCNCSNTTECPYTTEPTNFTRLNMTNAGPPQKSAEGVFLRGGTGAQTNPYGDYNQVEFSYCTSDAWKGTVRDIVLDGIHPKTGAPVTYRTHFLGGRVLDANLATLRHDGVAPLVYTLGGASTMMPDLDEATEVIVTGDSAGGSGVVGNLDAVTQSLRTTNPSVQVFGLLDAIVGPDYSRLDFGTFQNPAVRSYDAWIGLLSPGYQAIGARADTSCTAMHAADPGRCYDDSHVIRHHLTTPFFVRMALRDSNISRNYIENGMRDADMTPMTVGSFALTLHAELGQFASMLAPGSGTEERAAMTVAPGVFGPACTKHDTIHSTPDTYQTTITPTGGSPLRLFQVFEAWKTGGSPTSVLTQSMTLADTVCP